MCILSKSSQDIWDNPLHFNIEGNFLFSVHLVGILLNAGFKRNIRLQNLKLLWMQNPFFLFFRKSGTHTKLAASYNQTYETYMWKKNWSNLQFSLNFPSWQLGPTHYAHTNLHWACVWNFLMISLFFP